jgi:dipeptidyl aminopeptidase/acylaminoacyl peptidase
MKRFTFAIALVALVLAACGGKDEPGTQASQSPTTSPTPAVGPALVYSTTSNCPSSSCAAAEWAADRENDLWIYEIESGTHYRLTADGDIVVEVLPQFTGRNTVSFVQGIEEQKPGSALFELDLKAGSSAKELFKVEGGTIFRYDWSSDGSSVAFLNFDDEGASALRIWTRSDGKIRTVKSFPALLGRGVGLEDEVSVAWSPDGKSILVVDTFRDPPLKVTMWVLDLAGKDIIPARAGTFGRWGSDSKTIYYKDYSGSGDWFRLSASDNKKAKLAIPDERLNPAVSPRGDFIALNDGGSKPSVYVFDVEKGIERKLAAGVVPVWLSDMEMAITDVRPCTAEEECFEAPPWKPLGTASTLRAGGTKTDARFPGWTLNADVKTF